MTAKKPAKQWQSLAEREIRKLQEQGAFENLPGAGQPIPDLLEPYDEMWWVKKMLRRENLSVLPETLTLRAEIEKDIEALWKLAAESEVRSAIAAINAKIKRLNSTAHAGPMTSLSMMEEETIVRLWKARRL